MMSARINWWGKIPSPTDVVPVMHGEWIPETNNEIGVEKIISVDTYACSNCQEWVSVYDAWDIDYKYCPYCGARMDGK